MQVLIRARRVLVRRPWLYWLAIVIVAALVGAIVRHELRSVERARDAWGETVEVLVADGDHTAGDPVRGTPADHPVALVPDAAVAAVPPGARARQRIGAGEIIVEFDLVAGAGPGAAAEEGEVVIGLRDDLAVGAVVGAGVNVVADGAVLASGARIVGRAEEVLFVAVPVDASAAVADAARNGRAVLVFVP